MMKLYMQLIFVLLVLYQLFEPGLALRSGGSKYSNSKSRKENTAKTYGAPPPPSLPNASRRGLGITAWGIVALVVSIILTGMGFYYFTMCYPILCKKQRKYDMIGLPNVA